MATALVVVPLIDVFVGRACLRHIFVPQADVLVVNNTCDGAFTQELIADGWDVIDEGRNLGVAGSWNMGVDKVMYGHYDFMIVTSSSMIYLEGLRDLVAKLPDICKSPLVTGFGWHCKPIPRQQLEDVGPFDEVFFPGYYEDADFELRSKHAGWTGAIAMPVSAIDLGNGHGAMKVRIDYEKLARTWVRKWGGPPGEEIFTTPYGG